MFVLLVNTYLVLSPILFFLALSVSKAFFSTHSVLIFAACVGQTTEDCSFRLDLRPIETVARSIFQDPVSDPGARSTIIVLCKSTSQCSAALSSICSKEKTSSFHASLSNQTSTLHGSLFNTNLNNSGIPTHEFPSVDKYLPKHLVSARRIAAPASRANFPRSISVS